MMKLTCVTELEKFLLIGVTNMMQNRPTVTAENVAEVIAMMTGVPCY